MLPMIAEMADRMAPWVAVHYYGDTEERVCRPFEALCWTWLEGQPNRDVDYSVLSVDSRCAEDSAASDRGQRLRAVGRLLRGGRTPV